MIFFYENEYIYYYVVVQLGCVKVLLNLLQTNKGEMYPIMGYQNPNPSPIQIVGFILGVYIKGIWGYRDINHAGQM